MPSLEKSWSHGQADSDPERRVKLEDDGVEKKYPGAAGLSGGAYQTSWEAQKNPWGWKLPRTPPRSVTRLSGLSQQQRDDDTVSELSAIGYAESSSRGGEGRCGTGYALRLLDRAMGADFQNMT